MCGAAGECGEEDGIMTTALAEFGSRRLIMAAAFLVSPLGCGGSVEATPEAPCAAMYVPCALAAGELSVYCAPVAPVCLSAIPTIGDVMVVGCLDRDGRCQCSRSTVADGPSLECGAQ